MNYYPVISGPVAPYSNVAINAQFYQPHRFFISTITNGQTTLVTTTVDHDYVIGQLVRFVIPAINKIRELNGQLGYVISIPSATQVEVDLDSTSYNIFQTSTQSSQPQILAIGDINTGNINSSGRINYKTYIPGSFINISP